MEEARYWMWTKRNNSLSSDHQVALPHTKALTYGDSWEEQAFAEDAAGALGWPPRSYTCSFCRKEFKSAQALGGHMNVHRRDRARLKQPPSPTNNLSSTTTSLGIHQYPSQIRTLLYNQDSEVHDQFFASPINSLPSRVCTVPVIDQSNCDEKAVLSSPLLSPPSLQEKEKRVSLLWPNRFADRYCDTLDLEKDEKNLNFVESSKCKQANKRDYVAADLCVSLGFVVRETDNYCGEDDDDSSIMSFKRRRTDDATVSLFPIQTSSVDRNVVHPQLEIIEISSSAKEDLDLELRLGGRFAKVM